MCWGLKGEALLPPLGNNIRRRKDARNEMRADVLDYVGFGTMQLRFIIFYKIISLRSVPHNQAKPTANPLSQAEKSKYV